MSDNKNLRPLLNIVDVYVLVQSLHKLPLRQLVAIRKVIEKDSLIAEAILEVLKASRLLIVFPIWPTYRIRFAIKKFGDLEVFNESLKLNREVRSIPMTFDLEGSITAQGYAFAILDNDVTDHTIALIKATLTNQVRSKCLARRVRKHHELLGEYLKAAKFYPSILGNQFPNGLDEKLYRFANNESFGYQ